MGKRRMTRGSGNDPAEYQEEDSNGRRHAAYNRPLFFLCAMCIWIGLVPHWSSAEEKDGNCRHICWEKTVSKDVSFTDGVHENGISCEKSCRDLCANSELCIGTYWGMDSTAKTLSCWLQLTTGGGAGSLTAANHSITANCTDDCLPFCWKPKVDRVQTLGGIHHTDVKSEHQCKRVCIKDRLCNGIDWGIEQSFCYLLYEHKPTQFKVTHWELVRDLPTKCSKSEEQCTARCWTKAELPTVSFSDGLSKKGVSSEKDCKDLCGNNQTCTGIYWGLRASETAESCFFQMPSGGAADSMTKARNWTLSNCTGDCYDFCWLPKWEHYQTPGGVHSDGILDENQCKVICSNDKRCSGIDFNTTELSCWILRDLKLVTKTVNEPTNHWENIRNLPMVCSDAPSVVNTIGPESVKAAAAEDAVSENATQNATGEGAAVGKAPADNGTAQNETNNASKNETAPEAGKAPEGGGGGPTDTGESAMKGKGEPTECPTYMIGIITLASLMAALVLIIIGLVAYIISRTRPVPAKSGQLLTSSQSAFRSYQSIAPESPEASEG